MDGPTLFDKLLSKRGLNPNALAKAINRPTAQSGFDRFRKGLIQQPKRSDALEKAAKHLGVDVLAFYDPDLADREWERVASGESSPAMAPEQPSARHRAGVHANVTDGPPVRGIYPLISKVQAGKWTELCDNFQPGDADEWFPSTKNLGACGYFLKVEGRSMENPSARPSFTEGMLLHVNPELEPMPGHFVVVRREATQEATFKKYILIEGAPYLEAINPDWPKEEKYMKLQPGDAWCGVVVDASLGGLT